ncbi:hypothetical protein OHA79_19640 [Streptomyces sp. NBC_00841]|nr:MULTISPECIES: hypothetical protein [unclassified Streptomyces]MCX4534804.1 hypothetical protein [Streptomyces sp. NBC_01669]WRZ99865.1 hypothetical protein OHA79_19640 [Streptomyces sp. NBC_00841]
MNDLNARVDTETRNNMINHYDDGLQPTAQQWYRSGIKDADMKMGERY